MLKVKQTVEGVLKDTKVLKAKMCYYVPPPPTPRTSISFFSAVQYKKLMIYLWSTWYQVTVEMP